MGDRSPEVKPEEQFPLLKVDAGGDSVPAQAMLPPGWGVQCTRNCSWMSRWPECMSTCWMTLVLLGISALVVYALSLGAYRHQQLVFMRCNGTSPPSNVFYHQLVPRGAQVPFLRHSEYLANMAIQYRRLHFNVFYLIDDSNSRVSRPNRLLNKLLPYYMYGAFNYKPDDTKNIQALAEFHKRYHNVNVSIMMLSKYMASTTLRFKWKSIPTSFLPFYMRAIAVWENGGIGMDLATHSTAADSPTARRKVAILRQHNDGIVPEAYANALKKIDKEEDTALFTMFFGLVNRFLNETRSFLNRTLTVSPLAAEPKSEIVVRTHRSKREIDSNKTVETTNHPAIEVLNATTTDNVVQNHSSTLDPLSPLLLSKALENTSNISDLPMNKSDTAVVVFYDYHIVSADNMGPSYMVADGAAASGSRSVKLGEVRDARRSVNHLLSIDPDGSFVAASSRLHPFLGHLLSAGCLRMAPKFAIQDTLLTQCVGLLREDVYCNNIFIL